MQKTKIQIRIKSAGRGSDARRKEVEDEESTGRDGETSGREDVGHMVNQHLRHLCPFICPESSNSRLVEPEPHSLHLHGAPVIQI